VIEQEGEADQNEERAGDDAAAAATAERYADHHGTTPGVRFFITVIQAGMNGAMNLIVKVVARLFRVKIFLVAHGILLLSSRCAVRFGSLISVPPPPQAHITARPKKEARKTSRNNKTPARIRITGQNDTKIC